MFPKAKAIRNSDKNTTTNPIRYINMINDINIFDDFPVSNVLIFVTLFNNDSIYSSLSSLTSLYSTALIQGVTKSKKQLRITPTKMVFFNYIPQFILWKSKHYIKCIKK